MPRRSVDWRGAEALWITAAGWAMAGKKYFGHSCIATSDGVFEPKEVYLFPKVTGPAVYKSKKLWRRFIPEFIVTAYKDFMLKRLQPKIWPIENELNVLSEKINFVWEQHDLFPGPGRRIANKLGVPFVLYVHAPVVWETRKWGVKRPIWGTWIENNIEVKSLKRADLIACVSEQVRDILVKKGVPENKILVSPMSVDGTMFHPFVKGETINTVYGLEGKKVIGWIGSFRKFHGLETIILAFKKVKSFEPNAVLMLVGDGMEFMTIKNLVEKEGLNESVIFSGKQLFDSIPSFLVNFDIALVSAASAIGFHYSPLKLREYLATGRAVIAPRAGDLPNLFKEGEELLFYEAGNVNSLADQMILLLKDEKKRHLLQQNAKLIFAKEGTWEHELTIVCERLGLLLNN